MSRRSRQNSASTRGCGGTTDPLLRNDGGYRRTLLRHNDQAIGTARCTDVGRQRYGHQEQRRLNPEARRDEDSQCAARRLGELSAQKTETTSAATHVVGHTLLDD